MIFLQCFLSSERILSGISFSPSFAGFKNITLASQILNNQYKLPSAFHRGSLYFLHHLQSDTPSFAACLSCHYNLTLCCLFLRCADEDSKEYDRKYDTYRVRNCSTEV